MGAEYLESFSFTSALKESDGACSAQGKGISWCGTPHLRQALQVTAAQGGGFSVPPLAKVFNLVKPEGLSRCLIIKGVWTKDYCKPAGATDWTFSSARDGWLPSLCLCWITPKVSRRPVPSFRLVRKDALAYVATRCERYKGEREGESAWKWTLVCVEVEAMMEKCSNPGAKRSFNLHPPVVSSVNRAGFNF